MENYRNKAGKEGPAVILFRNIKTGSYQDGGGNIDQGESPEMTALRELQEESANLFRLSPDSLQDCPVYDHQDKYRAYALGVHHPNGIQSAHYDTNVKKLAEANASSCWQETDVMARFYIDEIQDGLSNKGPLECTDANGNRCVIFGRTKACIRELIKDNTKVPMVTLNFTNNNTKGRHKFLHGTNAYWT